AAVALETGRGAGATSVALAFDCESSVGMARRDRKIPTPAPATRASPAVTTNAFQRTLRGRVRLRLWLIAMPVPETSEGALVAATIGGTRPLFGHGVAAIAASRSSIATPSAW